MNPPLLIIIGILLIALIIFLVRRNTKHEKLLKRPLKNDYHKRKSDDEDILIHEMLK